MNKTSINKVYNDERETVLIYNYIDKKWTAETLVAKHYNKFLRQGWTQTDIYVDEEGRSVGGCFEAPDRSITIRGTDKKKMSKKQLDNLATYNENEENCDDNVN